MPSRPLDNLWRPLYNDFVVIDGDNIMIIRRETLNEISTMWAAGCSYTYIAGTLKIAVADVIAAIKAFKL